MMMGRKALLFMILAASVLLFAGRARASSADPTEELNAERDALIDKITRGTDYEESVRKFALLVKRRDQIVATSHTAQQQERTAVENKRNWENEYHKTPDYEVSWRCTLSADPAHPVPSTEGRFRGDWGKVIRKETLRFPPKNELDEGEVATMYEVAGLSRHYLIHGDHYGLPDRQPLRAEVGDLVLVCDYGTDIDRRLPPAWQGQIQRSGFAVPIARPPLITQKAKWNPIHITGTNFFWAIHDVKWKYPPEAYILNNLEVSQDLGGGRYRIETNNNLSWVLEVPGALKNRELLVPGHSVWAIMGHSRFDRELKTLVLVAEDLEARYIFPR